MKKRIYKISLFILCFVLVSSACVFADEETVIKNLANSILSVLSWIAYALALGALLFMGIKYMMSGANEKADLKGKFPKYLIGIAMIVLCFTIAQFVADIAGNNTAKDIIDVGISAGNHFSGGDDECQHEYERIYVGSRENYQDTCKWCGDIKRGKTGDESGGNGSGPGTSGIIGSDITNPNASVKEF